MDKPNKIKVLNLYAGIDKMKTIRNCVEPEAGKIIFDMAFRQQQKTLG